MRLQKISRDHTLKLKIADFRPSAQVLQLSLVMNIVQSYFGNKTVFFAVTGFAKNQLNTSLEKHEKVQSLSPCLFSLIKELSNLETLILEEHYIDANELPLSCFPSSVKHFSMKNCDVFNMPVKQSYFYSMVTIMPHLERLDLSGCQWFEDHSLMAISKCTNLKSLRVRNCPRVGVCPAYILLATRFGFDNIEVLDLRGTMIGGHEISAFRSKVTLKELYVDGEYHR